MRRKKVLLLVMAVVMLIGLLAGCSKGDGQKEPSGTIPKNESGSNSNEGNTDENAAGTAGGSNGGNGASGAYVEEEIALPEEVANGEYGVSDFLLNPEGNMILYASKMEEENTQGLKRYVLQSDDTWKEEAEPWMEAMDWTDRVVGGFSYDPDGNLYLTVAVTENGSWENLQNEFYRVKAENGELEKLDLKTGGEENLSIAGIYVNADGKVLEQPSAYPSNVTVADLESGKVLFEFLPENGTPIWYGDQIISTGDQGAKLVFLDGETGEQVNSITLHEGKPEEGTYYFPEVKIYAEQGKGIWLAGADGLTYLADGGSKWEVLLDPGLSVMGMPSYYVTGLMRDSEGTFYLSYLDSTSYKSGLARISYQEGVSSEQDTTLSIYSLSESDSIRQAVVEFQREHRNVKVEYRAVMGENSSATKEDCIQALNTELLAGKGADLIVTDGLPVESYIEKGVLADLSELADSLVKEGYILENVMNAMRQNQTGQNPAGQNPAGFYQIPTHMNLPIWVGTEKALQATGSIAELAAASSQAEIPYLGKENHDYMQLFGMLYYLYGGELTKGGVSKEKLSDFLENYLTLAKQSCVEASEDSEMYLILGSVNSTAGGNGALGEFDIPSLTSLMIPEKIMRDTGLGYVRSGESFQPVVSLAINQSSEQKELAGEFIKKMLSESIQDPDLDGIPVNPASLEKKPEHLQDNVSVGMHFTKLLPDGSKEESGLTAQCPTEEEMREFVTGLKKLNQTIIVDETVQSMFEAEIPALWRGEKDVEAVSESVFQKLQTYLAE